MYCLMSLVVGDTGSIGGSLSHEYHFPAETGEDELFHCDKCGIGANSGTKGAFVCNSLCNTTHVLFFI